LATTETALANTAGELAATTAELSTTAAELATTTAALTATAAELRAAKASIQLTALEIAKLKAQIAKLKRMQFGLRSERLCGGNSTICPRAARRRSPPRRCSGSQRSTPSRRRSAASPPDVRRAARQARSKPLVEALFTRLETQLARLPGRGPTAEKIRYALNHRADLERFLDDGRLDIDSNVVERCIRPLVLSRKNALFASGDDGGKRWTCIATLVETGKLNGVDPQRYFTAVLTRFVNGWQQSRIDELMPCHRAPAKNS